MVLSINQVATKVGIGAPEITQVCKLLGNPVQQAGDRTVVPDFKIGEETVSADVFFTELKAAAPTKDGKPDVLQSAIAFKKELDKTNNQKNAAAPNSYQELEEPQRLQFNRYVAQRLGISEEAIETVDPTSLQGLYLDLMRGSVEAASQMHHSYLELVMAQIGDRLQYGLSEDPNLLSQVEQEALGKSREGQQTPNTPASLVLANVNNISQNFLNFRQSAIPLIGDRRQLEPSRTTAALPQKR